MQSCINVKATKQDVNDILRYPWCYCVVCVKTKGGVVDDEPELCLTHFCFIITLHAAKVVGNNRSAVVKIVIANVKFSDVLQHAVLLNS